MAQTKNAAAKSAPQQANKSARKTAVKTKSINFSSDQLLEFYRQMLLIRRFEEKAGQLYGMGLIGGFCHLYIGQEAVVTGIQSALIKGDSVITSYRDHGHMLACGMDPDGVMAELTGREGGFSKGKGGSMHMFSVEQGFYGGHGIVGAQTPLGAGIAFAHKYQETGNIATVYLGDGAVNQGQVYETFNMASLWKLPVIFIVENNQYGMGTASARASASTEFFRRGSAYNIPGVQIDGMDVLAVHQEAQNAVDYVRSGKGPMILEAKTYRYRGHSMSDPAKYRTKEEVQRMRTEQDPIERLKSLILDGSYAPESALKDMDKEIKAIVAKSADFAQTSPEPSVNELYTDIYA